MDNPNQDADICRVCRLEAMPNKPLYHPCMCAGSIMYVHQNCLIRWINHTRKPVCELCNHEYSFNRTYSPNMPNMLIKDVIIFIISTLTDKIKFYLYIILLGILWLYIAPFIIWRIFQSLLNGTFEPLTTLPTHLLSYENILSNISDSLFTYVMVVIFVTTLALMNWDLILIDREARNEHNNEEIIIRLLPENHEEAGDEGIENQNEMNPPLELQIEEFFGLNNRPLLLFRIAINVIFFNVLAILVFVFCPYHIGKLAIAAMYLQDKVIVLYFEKPLIILFGYFLVAIFFFILHTIANFIGLGSFKQFFGRCYIFVKVLLLLIVDICVIPFLNACWMDIFSLSMFNISLKERIQCFYRSPSDFMVIHWISGLIFLNGFFYVLSIFRKITRPGILWFLENIIDYKLFNRLQVLKTKSLLYHCQKLTASITVYGIIIFILVWLPVQILKIILPSFLPYTAPTDDNYFDEWSMLIRFFMTLLVQRTFMQYWVEKGMRIWCNNVSRILGLKSYLLGDEPRAIPQEVPAFQPYTRPTYFVLRLTGLLIIAILTVILINLSIIIIPTFFVRLVMPLFPSFLPKTTKPYRQMTVFEVYFSILHLYLLRILLQVFLRFVYPSARRLLLEGWAIVMNRLKPLFENSFIVIISFTILLCIIPQLFGILFQLVMVMPFKMHTYQSPLIWQMQDIVFHLCCIKLLVLFFIFGPTYSFKRALQQVYTDGFANFNFNLIIKDIAKPVVCVLCLLLSVSYIFAYSVLPFFIDYQRIIRLTPSMVFLTIILIVLAVKFLIFLVRTCKIINQRILNERYEIGRELVNYYRT